MVRTRVIFVISFSGKLVTCLFHRRADNMVVETGSIFSNKTPHYHSFIILMGNLKRLRFRVIARTVGGEAGGHAERLPGWFCTF